MLEVIMTISTRLNEYLDKNNIAYKTVPHFHSTGSISTAVASSIHPKNIAKAVLLVDHDGHKVMAVLPADKKICISTLNEKFNASYQLIKEKDIYNLFADCDEGAIPPVGGAFNMTVVCDDLLDTLDGVYIEAGDHQTLLQVDHEGFKSIMANAKHTRFSEEMLH
jgi:Ala-tRNA(Pro) deacylase